MKIVELSDEEYNWHNESPEVINNLLSIFKDARRESKNIETLVKLLKIAKEENKTEEWFENECKKYNI
ncbi:MAG: hypothetical protein HC836_16475 [Richelia sp. RM2_1_2]|nr:hypothetical protein [Richelia sp. RM2_1_2]